VTGRNVRIEGGLAIDSASVRRGTGRRTVVIALLVSAVSALLAPTTAAAQDARMRQAMLLADSLGQLSLTLRAYAQVGLEVEPAEAGERLRQGREEFDALLARLLRRGGKGLPAADGKRLQQRWRSIRDATFTRPSPEIGALMSDIGDDIALQLHALTGIPPQSDPLLDRRWQLQNLQQLAKEGLFGCWRRDLARPDRIAAISADFNRWLAAQEQRLAKLAWVQYNAQWNLLTTSLPRQNAGCSPQALRSLVGTTERLTQMIASSQ